MGAKCNLGEGESKNLLKKTVKMADFCHFLFQPGGK